MKNQALFSSNDKTKKLKCYPLQFLFGALRVKIDSRDGIKSYRCMNACLHNKVDWEILVAGIPSHDYHRGKYSNFGQSGEYWEI